MLKSLSMIAGLPTDTVKLAASMRAFRQARRTIRSAKVMARGTGDAQVQAYGRLKGLQKELFDESQSLAERGGGFRGILSFRANRRNRKLLKQVERPLRGLEKAKPVRASVAQQSKTEAAETAAAASGGGGGFGKVIGGTGILGAGYLAGGAGTGNRPAPGAGIIGPARVPQLRQPTYFASS